MARGHAATTAAMAPNSASRPSRPRLAVAEMADEAMEDVGSGATAFTTAVAGGATPTSASRVPSVKTSSSSSQLASLYRRLTEVTAQQAVASVHFQPQPLQAAQVQKGCAVVKWIDYSLKYGLAYKLSNGTYGVLFNDNTKMVLAADEE